MYLPTRIARTFETRTEAESGRAFQIARTLDEAATSPPPSSLSFPPIGVATAGARKQSSGGREEKTYVEAGERERSVARVLRLWQNLRRASCVKQRQRQSVVLSHPDVTALKDREKGRL